MKLTRISVALLLVTMLIGISYAAIMLYRLSTMVDDVLHSWLHSVPCPPPCWQGIIPGQTMVPEAVAILEGSPAIANVEIVTATQRYEIFGGEVFWELSGFPKRNGGRMDFEGSPPIVKSINVWQDDFLTLQNVIDIYGQPSHVLNSNQVENHRN